MLSTSSTPPAPACTPYPALQDFLPTDSGCAFYRPDPSFLPAVEDHIRALKADREMAKALGTAEFVVRNFSDQIDS